MLASFRLVVSSTNYNIVFRQRSRAELRTLWPGLWVLFLDLKNRTASLPRQSIPYCVFVGASLVQRYYRAAETGWEDAAPMTSKWVSLISRIARRIWFRATSFSILAVATALIAIVAAPYIPASLFTHIGANAVEIILGIIASSMLTVTTFSLSTMVAVYSAATGNVTPRSTRPVMEDNTTPNVLATFIGSFVALTTGGVR